MGEPTPTDVTRLLLDWSRGDRTALDRLMPLAYDQLRALADRSLCHERSGHTLQGTALVHEAYLKLVDQCQVSWQDRAHFLGVAAQLMRRILVDHVRRHRAAKRGRASAGCRSTRPRLRRRSRRSWTGWRSIARSIGWRR